MMEKKFDLEERLIEFAAQLIHFTESMVSSKSGNHLANQLLRSGTSPALNYGGNREKILYINLKSF